VRLSLRTLLAYGCPGLPLAALGLPLYVYLPGYYADELGLGLTAVGAVLLTARLFDVFSDPIIGAISDRYHIRGTRRKGLIVLGVPILMLGIEFLFRPLASISAWYLFFWSMLSYLGWTLIALPYSAWGAELSSNYHERARITVSREGFVIVGTLGAAAAPALFGDQQAVAETLNLLATALWVLIPLTVLIAVRLVPERSVGAPAVQWLQGVRLMRKNGPFLRLIAAYVLNGVSSGLPATLFILFVANVLNAPKWTGPLLVLYFAAGVLSLPVWLRLAHIWGKHRTWAASMLWACGVFVWVPFLGQGDVVLFAVICVLSGLSLGVDLALPASIQADVIDLDTLNGGGERAGLFFGLWGMATKLAFALAVGIAFPLLDLANFVPGEANTASALLTLAFLYGGLPVLLKLASVTLVWNFPLDKQAHTAIQDRMARANEEDSQNYETINTADVYEHEPNGVRKH